MHHILKVCFLSLALCHCFSNILPMEHFVKMMGVLQLNRALAFCHWAKTVVYTSTITQVTK